MKTFFIGAASISIFGGSLLAQVATSGISVASTQGVPAPTAYHVVDRQANQKLWQREVYQKLRDGRVICHTNAYVEMASGMHYQDATGNWVESQELIEPFAGGAVAARGQFQVIFANNLNTAGAIDLQTPDGLRLRSNILGLDFYDRSTGRRQVIAQVQDAQGELVGSNQVLYPNAFDGVKAGVRYTYRKGSFEQDVIINEQLPTTPEAYGMNADTTELEVMTEFLNPPDLEPATPHRIDTEQQIAWGRMLIGHGKAFELGNPDDPVTVERQYVTVEGRNILFEALPLRLAQASLSKLPLHASIEPEKLKRLGARLPKPLLARRESQPMKVAMARKAEPAYVLDYILINTDPGSYTFRGDMTYYISDHVGFWNGKITFEGGAVLKHNTDPAVQPLVDEFFGGVECDATPYRPVVFTSINDDSVGQSLYDSSKPLEYYWGAIAGSSSSDVVWHDLRVKYAHYGLDATHMQLSDCQFVNCLYPILQDLTGGCTCNATNVLIENADAAFSGISFAAAGYQITVNNSTNLTLDWNGNTDSTLALTNSLLVNVQGTGSATLSSNYTAWVTDTGGQVLQTVGGGSCYLATNSSYRGAGTANVDPGVLAVIAPKTTYPPNVYSNGTVFGVNTTLSPSVARDTNASPDLGYHYDPIDYVVASATLSNNIAMNLTPGTVFAWYAGGGCGLMLFDGATFNSRGTVTMPCWVVHTTLVQEGNGWASDGAQGLSFEGVTATNQPVINATFTKWSGLNFTANLIQDDFSYGVGNFTDCEFYDSTITAYESDVFCTNCLLSRMYITFWDGTDPTFTFQDCTFNDGMLIATRTGGQASFWTAINNAFDGTAFQLNDNYQGTNYTYFDYNAYNTNNLSWQGILFYSPATNRLEVMGAHSFWVTNFNWQTSWFGNYYLPTDSPLIDAGSTNANWLGLGQFTTQTNEIYEGNSIVDIGYHYYVRMDTNGLAIWWEMLYFGQTGIDPNADPDGDGMSNLQEYLAGTNPTVDDSTVPSSRLNYTYDAGGWLKQVSGIHSGTVSPDNQGNVQQSSQ